MGTPDFAVPSLEILIDNGLTPVVVVTAPDKPRGRGQEVLPTPVKSTALRHNIPLLQPESLSDQTFDEQVRALSPDIIVVVAFRILPRSIFTIPRLGAFNLHASLLPKYRGAAPINWAIMNGEKETGVTSFLLQEKVDTGNILLSARTPIKPEDDAGSLHDRLSEIGAEIVLHTVRLLEQGKATPRPQDDTQATPAPKIFKDNCKIRWEKPAVSVHNQIRGLSPYPAAFTPHNGKVSKVFRSDPIEADPTGTPGSVHVQGAQLFVSTGDALIEILELQQEGRKRMSSGEFLRGYPLQPGDSFA